MENPYSLSPAPSLQAVESYYFSLIIKANPCKLLSYDWGGADQGSGGDKLVSSESEKFVQAY